MAKRKKAASWHLSQAEYRAIDDSFKAAKVRYAKAVMKALPGLPKRLHPIAFRIAIDVSFEVVMEGVFHQPVERQARRLLRQARSTCR